MPETANGAKVIDASPTKAGWRVSEFARDTGLSRAFIYGVLGTLDSVKIGAMRIITTTPAEFLARHREGDR